jgi:hypothetical protein
MVRTTTTRLASACRSCRAGRSPEGCEVTPFVGLVKWMRVMDSGVGSIDLGGTVLGKECVEGLVEEGGVGDPGP